jgi:hypothetical protein
MLQSYYFFVVYFTMLSMSAYTAWYVRVVKILNCIGFGWKESWPYRGTMEAFWRVWEISRKPSQDCRCPAEIRTQQLQNKSTTIPPHQHARSDLFFCKSGQCNNDKNISLAAFSCFYYNDLFTYMMTQEQAFVCTCKKERHQTNKSEGRGNVSFMWGQGNVCINELRNVPNRSSRSALRTKPWFFPISCNVSFDVINENRKHYLLGKEIPIYTLRSWSSLKTHHVSIQSRGFMTVRLVLWSSGLWHRAVSYVGTIPG